MTKLMSHIAAIYQHHFSVFCR